MLGLQRNTVALVPHEKEWEDEAKRTVERLNAVLGDTAKACVHVGSTSITHICAKPIIDIAVAVDDLEDVIPYYEELAKAGFEHIPKNDDESQVFFSCGNKSIRTHYIHVVRLSSDEWANYNNFRDYCNTKADVARAYEKLKMQLAATYPTDREKYTEGKAQFIQSVLKRAGTWAMLGKTVTVKITNPDDNACDNGNSGIPVSRGYIENVKIYGKNNQSCYVLGIANPADEFTGVVSAVIYRKNSPEDMLVVTADSAVFDQAQIAEAVDYREKSCVYELEHLYHSSCGFIVYRASKSEPEFLLLHQSRSGTYSVPKGHREKSETEEETAQREAFEEVGINVTRKGDFKAVIKYRIEPIYEKTVTLFLAEYDGELKCRPDEISSCRWLTLEEVRPFILPVLYNALAEAALYIKNFKLS